MNKCLNPFATLRFFSRRSFSSISSTEQNIIAAIQSHGQQLTNAIQTLSKQFYQQTANQAKALEDEVNQAFFQAFPDKIEGSQKYEKKVNVPTKNHPFTKLQTLAQCDGLFFMKNGSIVVIETKSTVHISNVNQLHKNCNFVAQDYPQRGPVVGYLAGANFSEEAKELVRKEGFKVIQFSGQRFLVDPLDENIDNEM
jgi:hypothetical protein